VANLLFLILGPDKPSSKTRVLAALDFLRARGHEVDARQLPQGLVGRVARLFSAGRYDLVVLQKKLLNPLQFQLLRRASRRLVYDFDDAVMFHEIERREPVRGRFFARFTATVAACDGVIAGNSYLAEFARAARDAPDGVAILPTAPDERLITAKSYGQTERVVIGWMGTKGNLQHLKAIAPALRRVCAAHANVIVRVVADAAPELPGVALDYKPWRRDDERGDLHSFDIGVMPLADDLWTRGKGGFKLLQYMAAGVPAVAAPVGINCEIIDDGVNGFLAGSEDAWVSRLEQLVGDRELREGLGRCGRQTVEAEYSLTRYRERLADFLESLL
jgi:glycosyltransferase involved in cell wall biosynthesis